VSLLHCDSELGAKFIVRLSQVRRAALRRMPLALPRLNLAICVHVKEHSHVRRWRDAMLAGERVRRGLVPRFVSKTALG
jgi:hypothetical protein